jgi:hypothetical protein
MAVTWKKLAYSEDVIEKTFLTAKGDLIAASGAGAPAVLGVGTNGQVLTADSVEAGGVKWADPSGDGDFMADGSVPMTGNLDFAGNQADDMVLQTVADSTARAGLTPTIGQVAWQTDELAAYICTVDS